MKPSYALDTHALIWHLAPLNFSIIKNLERIPYHLVPDMPDRLIATTALTSKIPLLSRDTDIANVSEIEVIW